ncbi:MAG: chemotaxis protein CheW, partial [Verrucomicrobiales bacterium]
RFRSVLLEGGEAVRVVSAYIDLNPVRAGIVADPKDYRWCSYAAAVAGSLSARAGLTVAVAGANHHPSWPTVSASYRQLLFGIGEAASDPKGSRRAGFTRAQVEAVWKEGGKLSLAQALRCRVRYFSAGTALGSQAFLDEFFRAKRNSFGGKRRGGARKMSGADWGELHSLRALRLNAISAPCSDPAGLD